MLAFCITNELFASSGDQLLFDGGGWWSSWQRTAAIFFSRRGLQLFLVFFEGARDETG